MRILCTNPKQNEKQEKKSILIKDLDFFRIFLHEKITGKD